MSNIGHTIYDVRVFKYIGRPILYHKWFNMDAKYGCDMRGMLSFHILWILSRKSMHGEQIAEEIGKRRGSKPKAGTIYPALKDLKTKGLIKGRKDGKTIVYVLTPEGKRTVKYTSEYFCRAFGEIFDSRKRN